ncbi:DNA polymerase ligase-domain-containing protein [Aspergillus falconensis]
MNDASDAKRRLSTLDRPISPPPTRPLTRTGNDSLSALEAGKEEVDDPLERISARLRKFTPDRNTTRPIPSGFNLIPIDAWKSLYTRNCHPSGNHFVIHQHDHPIAGPHYDLRLQFSASSSLSWSVMYGLPGDPNSRRLNRNATETRVHALWNHLIETASEKTGSMIIWDTGEYEVLPDKSKGSNVGPETDESDYEHELHSGSGLDGSALSESEKLRNAFQNSKIHLRLHGTRLPKNYTVFLRRDKTDFRSAPTAASLLQKPRKRRRRQVTKAEPSSTSNSESDTDITGPLDTKSPGTGKRGRQTDTGNEGEHEHSDAEGGDNDVDFQIRLNNAYPGAVNDIGSIHQRRWFIMLDRAGSGFVPEKVSDMKTDSAGKKRWIRGIDKRSGASTGFDPFHVRGPEVERSVVTGRRGPDVLHDEGVEVFVPRKGWTPVLV